MSAAPPSLASVTVDPLYEAVAASKGGDPLAPVTIVTPSTYAAVATRRALALAAGAQGRGGVANVSCTTLDLLVAQLGAPSLWRRGLRPVPAAVETEVIRQVAGVGAEPWRRLASHPRTLVALHSAFSELRRLTASALEALARQSVRGAEVAGLLVAVRNHLRERALADGLDLREAALEAVSEDRPLPEELGAVVLFELPPLSPGETAFLDALAGRAPCLTVEAAAPPPADERWVCSDPEQEVRTAVRQVLAGVEAGVPLWRHALLHPPGPAYPRLIHQELNASGIPSNGPEHGRLDGTGAGRTLLGLLELAGGEWTRSQVLAFMASGPLRTGPDGRPVPVSRWNAVSAAAGVVRGLGQWRERLERYAEREPIERDEALALADFVEDLAARTSAAPRGWAGRAEWAVDLLERYLDPESGGPWPPEQRLALAQVADVVRGLSELDSVSHGSGGAEGAVDPARFRAAVRAELERHHLDTTELPGGGVGDGVFVAPFDRARGMRFHTTVLVGLADSLVPGRGTDDALLPDELRAMDASGALPVRARRHERARLDVEAALAAGTERRVVLSPAVDPRTGREQVPSRFLAALARSAPVQRIESFAGSLSDAGPALSAGELTLRTLGAWVSSGASVTASPPVLFDGALRTGIEAVRARAGRSFTRFDGLTGLGMVTPFDPANPVSATRLETYAECPRKFLFERVLGIHDRVLPEDLWRIEARSRGSLVHAVLERYVSERIAGAPRSLERLLEIADEHLDEAAAGGLVGKALLWRIDRAAIARDLRTFHDEEGGSVPLAVELSFGDDESATPPVVIDLADGRSVQFRGRADRVDRGPGGELVVSDYKTGRQTGISKLGSSDPLDGGRRLQLPLYALAARQAFGGEGEAVLARYWMVSAERSATYFQLELDDRLERHFADVVGRIARGIDQGCFPAIPGAPRENTFEGCMYCDFDRVCPASRDRQWAAKRGAPALAPVDDLLAVEAGEPLSASLVRTSRPGRPGGGK
jgi:ATP-dependent helicase/nuclease subunit B